MRNIFRFLCVPCFVGLVWAPASAQSLSKDELTRLMAGTSIETTTFRDGSPFFMRFNADGSLEGRVETDQSERLDDGKWWTDVPPDRGAARLCYRFEEFSLGRKFCWSSTVEYDGRTIARYKGDGSRLKNDWVITKPGPQASAVIAAKKATRIAGAPQAVPPPVSRPIPMTRALVSASAQYLSKDELGRLMEGTTVETTTSRDFPLFVRFNADGALDGRIDANEEFLDDGKWWMEESQDGAATLCHQFEKFGKGRVRCNRIAIENDGRNIGRYRLDGSRRRKDWVITKLGPQAGAVIAARKATRIAGQSPPRGATGPAATGGGPRRRASGH